MITADDIKKSKWRAVIFGDGEGGMAFQQYACEEFPEAAVTWSRENGKDKGTMQLFVGALEVPDLETMAEQLNARRAATSVIAPAPEDGT